MNENRKPMTEGEMERVAEGLRAVADVQEAAIPKSFMAARLGQAQRIRAMVDLLRLGASNIEQLIGSQIDLGLVPIRLVVASHASVTVHVHPIVAAELERLREIEAAYDEFDAEQNSVDDELAQQKLDGQP